MSSVKLFSKSRTISLIVGLVIVALLVPGIVSAKTVSQPVVTAANDRPIAGDWNGDGIIEKGVYRPGVGFYLKMDDSSTWNPSTDKYLAWDNVATDLPIAGDWNGDGRDETGVYRPRAGFYLKMDSGNTWNPSTDKYLAWDNAAGDLPIAGDWNADGKDETGVYRPGYGFFLKMSNGNTWRSSTDKYITWDNAAGDRPIAGDWNGDELDETGVYRPGVGFYLKMKNDNTWNPSTDRYLNWDNLAGDLPIAGDWNGDGLDETGVTRGNMWYFNTKGNSILSSSFTVTTTKAPSTTVAPTVVPVIYGNGDFGYTSNPTGNPVGGGAGYSRIISETSAGVAYVVSTKAELLTALKSAKAGETVFVRGTSVIDMTGTPSVTIPAGVTLASSRGLAGSAGAILKRTKNLNGGWEEPMLIAGGDNVRVTGLRLEGEMYPQDYGNNDVIAGSINERYYLVGIYAQNKKGFEVDNCELYGWAWSTISLRGNVNSPVPYIHHNYIHHNQARGEGYGVNLYGGNALIEANLFDYNRHDVTGAGMKGEQYEARYNHHLGHGNPIGATNYDVHQDEETGTGLAGNLFRIHHNTIDGGVIAMLQVRGKPQTGMYVYNNVINSVASDTGVTGNKPIFQTSAGTGNMFVTQNYWLGKLYPTDSGIVVYY